MLKAEQIPDEVWTQVALRLESCGAVVSNDVAKLVAAEAINAWPGMLTMPATPDGQWTPWATTSAHIILPLPTEKETSE